MKCTVKLMNGLVFGLAHQYYLDFDSSEGEDFAERLANAPKVPMVFIYFGPFQFILTW